MTDFIFARIAVSAKESVSSHQHSGSAVAALQTMFLKETVLERMQFAVLFEAFDGHDCTPISLDREHRARLDRASIHHDCARAAVTGVTTDVCSGEPQVFTKEVDQQ